MMIKYIIVAAIAFVALTASPCNSENIKVTTIVNDPFLKQENGEFVGYLKELLEHLEQALEWNAELQLVADGKYGSKNEDGSWTGMIGEVLNGDADIALAPLTVTNAREADVKFTVPFMMVDLAAVYKTPTDGQQIRFTNINELIASQFKYIVVAGGSTYYRFKVAKYPLPFAQIRNVMNDYWEDMPKSAAEGLEMVRSDSNNGSYAFIGETSYLKHTVNNPPCDLSLVEFGAGRSYAIAVSPERADLLPLISGQLLQMHEDGTLQMLYDKWWTNNCPKQTRRLCVCSSADSSSEDN